MATTHNRGPYKEPRQYSLEDVATKMAHENPMGLVQLYLDLRVQLTKPPAGWSVLGSHLSGSDTLEFWGSGADGLPIWERPVGSTN